MSRRRSKVVSRCFGIVLGKTPGTILFMLPQAEAVPCTHSWEPTTAVLLPLSLRTSARTGVAIRFPFCRGTFFPAKESTQRTPPKPRFWNPSAYRHAINENLYLAQSVCANLPLLSHAPCVYHRCPLLQWNRNARSDNRGSHRYASVGEDNSVRPTVTK